MIQFQKIILDNNSWRIENNPMAGKSSIKLFADDKLIFDGSYKQLVNIINGDETLGDTIFKITTKHRDFLKKNPQYELVFSYYGEDDFRSFIRKKND